MVWLGNNLSLTCLGATGAAPSFCSGPVSARPTDCFDHDAALVTTVSLAAGSDIPGVHSCHMSQFINFFFCRGGVEPRA